MTESECKARIQATWYVNIRRDQWKYSTFVEEHRDGGRYTVRIGRADIPLPDVAALMCQCECIMACG